MRNNFLSEEECSFQVDLQEPVEVRFIDIKEWTWLKHPGVVHEYVDAAKAIYGGVDDPLAILLQRDIGDHRQGALRHAELCYRRNQFLLVRAGHDNVVAGIYECRRNGLAQPSGGAGDDSGFGQL